MLYADSTSYSSFACGLSPSADYRDRVSSGVIPERMQAPIVSRMTESSCHEAALRVVEDVFGDSVRAGRASYAVVETRDPYPVPAIEVSPVNPAACPVTIFAGELQIDIAFGSEGVVREIYSRDEQERLDELRGCLLGVLEGRYEEVVEWRGRKHTGRFNDGAPPYTHYGAQYGQPRMTKYDPY